jgi:hypothetical protein
MNLCAFGIPPIGGSNSKAMKLSTIIFNSELNTSKQIINTNLFGARITLILHSDAKHQTKFLSQKEADIFLIKWNCMKFVIKDTFLETCVE